jgi:hypothetical protein
MKCESVYSGSEITVPLSHHIFSQSEGPRCKTIDIADGGGGFHLIFLKCRTGPYTHKQEGSAPLA